MRLVFRTDDSINNRGFSLTYTAIEAGAPDELELLGGATGLGGGASSLAGAAAPPAQYHKLKPQLPGPPQLPFQQQQQQQPAGG